MKHLIVYSHPNPQSFSHAIMSTYANELKELGNDVRVRDLYAIGFDPVLKADDFMAMREGITPGDIAREQEEIRWAEQVTFIYPTWWTGLPAMLKGYVDRVFVVGFAFAVTEEGPAGLLTGKKARAICTTGTPFEIYHESGMFKSMKKTIDEGIFRFCGMEVLDHKFFGAVPYVSDAERKAMLEEVKLAAAGE